MLNKKWISCVVESIRRQMAGKTLQSGLCVPHAVGDQSRIKMAGARSERVSRVSHVCRSQGRRRALLTPISIAGATTLLSVFAASPALAVQGLTAGRIPGVSNEVDADGFRRRVSGLRIVAAKGHGPRSCKRVAAAPSRRFGQLTFITHSFISPFLSRPLTATLTQSPRCMADLIPVWDGCPSTRQLIAARRYVRPVGKSGGHGVGWSELPRVRR